MCRDNPAGFALPSAIFLIVVLAALGAIAVTVSGLQHTSSARDVMGTKAYQAARSGIEWGAYKVLQQGSPGVCPASTSIPMPAGTDLSGLTVNVSCDPDSETLVEPSDSLMITPGRCTRNSTLVSDSPEASTT